MDMGFLDKLLNDAVAFPITVLGLLFFPDKLLAADTTLPVSGPGFAFILSFAVYFYADTLSLSLEFTPRLKLSRVVKKDELLRTSTIGVLVIMSQWFSIDLLFDLEAKGRTLPEVIGILSYSVSVPFFLRGLVFLILFTFPINRTIFGYTIRKIWDRAMKKARTASQDGFSPNVIA